MPRFLLLLILCACAAAAGLADDLLRLGFSTPAPVRGIPFYFHGPLKCVVSMQGDSGAINVNTIPERLGEVRKDTIVYLGEVLRADEVAVAEKGGASYVIVRTGKAMFLFTDWTLDKPKGRILCQVVEPSRTWRFVFQ